MDIIHVKHNNNHCLPEEYWNIPSIISFRFLLLISFGGLDWWKSRSWWSYKIIDMMSNPERYNCVIYKNNDGKAHNRYDQYNYESSPVESITWLHTFLEWIWYGIGGIRSWRIVSTGQGYMWDIGGRRFGTGYFTRQAVIFFIALSQKVIWFFSLCY